MQGGLFAASSSFISTPLHFFFFFLRSTLCVHLPCPPPPPYCHHEGRPLWLQSFRRAVEMHRVCLAPHHIWSRSSTLPEALDESAKPTAVPLHHSLSHPSICPFTLLLLLVHLLLCLLTKQIKSIDCRFVNLKLFLSFPFLSLVTFFSEAGVQG